MSKADEERKRRESIGDGKNKSIVDRGRAINRKKNGNTKPKTKKEA